MSENFDENRELCDDGNCLGVVIDHRCNLCGIASNSSSNSDSSSSSNFGSEIGSETVGCELSAVSSESSDSPDGFDPDRALCPDGACTGLLGSDSKCKVCGRTP
jgi:hypothetical protein